MGMDMIDKKDEGELSKLADTESEPEDDSMGGSENTGDFSNAGGSGDTGSPKDTDNTDDVGGTSDAGNTGDAGDTGDAGNTDNEGNPGDTGGSADPPPLTAEEALTICRHLEYVTREVEGLLELKVLSNECFLRCAHEVCEELKGKFDDDKWTQAQDQVKKEAEKMCLLNDVPFELTFRDKDGLIAKLLMTLTGKPHIEIARVHMQMRLKSPGRKRTYVLDCYAVDTEGNIYNLEPQIRSDGANGKRALAHIAKIVNDALKPGMDPKDLHETWIIFLCWGDPMKRKQVLYEEKFAESTGQIIGHIVYFSTSVANRWFKKKGGWDTPQEGIEPERWHDLLRWGVNLRAKTSADVIENDDLKQCVKDSMDVDERGQSGVTNEIVKMINEAWAEATAKDKAEIAAALLKKGMPPQEVAEVTGLSIKDVNRLKASLGATQKSTKKSA